MQKRKEENENNRKTRRNRIVNHDNQIKNNLGKAFHNSLIILKNVKFNNNQKKQKKA